MGNIVETYNRLKSIDIWAELKGIIRSKQSEILSLNKGQLQKGILSTGDKTYSHSRSAMSRKYVSDKISRGVYDSSIYPSVNLYNEGDFYKAFRIVIADLYIEIISEDSKAGKLEQRYTHDIYGLTDENMKYLITILLPELQTKIRQKLGI
jgi:hypothetical protein